MPVEMMKMEKVPYDSAKIEDKKIVIDLDQPNTAYEIVLEWHIEIKKLFARILIPKGKDRVIEAMKYYIHELEKRAINFEDVGTLQTMMEYHLQHFHWLYHDTDFSCPEEQYFKSMEDILTFYMNTFLRALLKMKEKFKMNQPGVMKRTQKLILILSYYLFGKENHIHHVLMRQLMANPMVKDIVDIHNSTMCKYAFTAIYTYYILSTDTEDRSDEAICRMYILLKNWQSIINHCKTDTQIESSLQMRFNRNQDFIKDSEILIKVFRPKSSIMGQVEKATVGFDSSLMRIYFDHINSKTVTDEEDYPPGFKELYEKCISEQPETTSENDQPVKEEEPLTIRNLAAVEEIIVDSDSDVEFVSIIPSKKHKEKVKRKKVVQNNNPGFLASISLDKDLNKRKRNPKSRARANNHTSNLDQNQNDTQTSRNSEKDQDSVPTVEPVDNGVQTQHFATIDIVDDAPQIENLTEQNSNSDKSTLENNVDKRISMTDVQIEKNTSEESSINEVITKSTSPSDISRLEPSQKEATNLMKDKFVATIKMLKLGESSDSIDNSFNWYSPSVIEIVGVDVNPSNTVEDSSCQDTPSNNVESSNEVSQTCEPCETADESNASKATDTPPITNGIDEIVSIELPTRIDVIVSSETTPTIDENITETTEKCPEPCKTPETEQLNIDNLAMSPHQVDDDTQNDLEFETSTNEHSCRDDISFKVRKKRQSRHGFLDTGQALQDTGQTETDDFSIELSCSKGQVESPETPPSDQHVEEENNRLSKDVQSIIPDPPCMTPPGSDKEDDKNTEELPKPVYTGISTSAFENRTSSDIMLKKNVPAATSEEREVDDSSIPRTGEKRKSFDECANVPSKPKKRVTINANPVTSIQTYDAQSVKIEFIGKHPNVEVPTSQPNPENKNRRSRRRRKREKQEEESEATPILNGIDVHNAPLSDTVTVNQPKGILKSTPLPIVSTEVSTEISTEVSTDVKNILIKHRKPEGGKVDTVVKVFQSSFTANETSFDDQKLKNDRLFVRVDRMSDKTIRLWALQSERIREEARKRSQLFRPYDGKVYKIEFDKRTQEPNVNDRITYISDPSVDTRRIKQENQFVAGTELENSSREFNVEPDDSQISSNPNTEIPNSPQDIEPNVNAPITYISEFYVDAGRIERENQTDTVDENLSEELNLELLNEIPSYSQHIEQDIESMDPGNVNTEIPKQDDSVDQNPENDLYSTLAAGQDNSVDDQVIQSVFSKDNRDESLDPAAQSNQNHETRQIESDHQDDSVVHPNRDLQINSMNEHSQNFSNENHTRYSKDEFQNQSNGDPQEKQISTKSAFNELVKQCCDCTSEIEPNAALSQSEALNNDESLWNSNSILQVSNADREFGFSDDQVLSDSSNPTNVLVPNFSDSCVNSIIVCEIVIDESKANCENLKSETLNDKVESDSSNTCQIFYKIVPVGEFSQLDVSHIPNSIPNQQVTDAVSEFQNSGTSDDIVESDSSNTCPTQVPGKLKNASQSQNVVQNASVFNYVVPDKALSQLDVSHIPNSISNEQVTDAVSEFPNIVTSDKIIESDLSNTCPTQVPGELKNASQSQNFVENLSVLNHEIVTDDASPPLDASRISNLIPNQQVPDAVLEFQNSNIYPYPTLVPNNFQHPSNGTTLVQNSPLPIANFNQFSPQPVRNDCSETTPNTNPPATNDIPYQSQEPLIVRVPVSPEEIRLLLLRQQLANSREPFTQISSASDTTFNTLRNSESTAFSNCQTKRGFQTKAVQPKAASPRNRYKPTGKKRGRQRNDAKTIELIPPSTPPSYNYYGHTSEIFNSKQEELVMKSHTDISNKTSAGKVSPMLKHHESFYKPDSATTISNKVMKSHLPLVKSKPKNVGGNTTNRRSSTRTKNTSRDNNSYESRWKPVCSTSTYVQMSESDSNIANSKKVSYVDTTKSSVGVGTTSRAPKSNSTFSNKVDGDSTKTNQLQPQPVPKSYDFGKGKTEDSDADGDNHLPLKKRKFSQPVVTSETEWYMNIADLEVECSITTSANNTPRQGRPKTAAEKKELPVAYEPTTMNCNGTCIGCVPFQNQTVSDCAPTIPISSVSPSTINFNDLQNLSLASYKNPLQTIHTYNTPMIPSSPYHTSLKQMYEHEEKL